MKSTILFAALTPSLLLAQGPETPPGPPGPTQKSLQEIWDRIASLEAAATEAAQNVENLAAIAASQQTLIENQSASLIAIHRSLGLEMPWSPMEIPGAGNPNSPSLDYNPAGFPAVAYFELDAQDLRFAVFDGNNWSIETVESQGNTGQSPSFLFDRFAVPTITFSRGSELVFARKSGANWTFETVASGMGSSHRPSLAISAANQPVISFCDTVTGKLRIATRSANFEGPPDWQIEEALSSNSPVSSTSEFSPSGTHVVFYHQLSSAPLYRQIGNTSASVLSSGTDGANPSLTHDQQGSIFVSYYTASGDLAIYNHNLASTETVDGGPDDVGRRSSISTGPLGEITIAYTDFTNDAIKFAARHGANWEIATLATGYSGGLVSVSHRHAPDGRPGVIVAGSGRLTYLSQSPF